MSKNHAQNSNADNTVSQIDPAIIDALHPDPRAKYERGLITLQEAQDMTADYVILADRELDAAYVASVAANVPQEIPPVAESPIVPAKHDPSAVYHVPASVAEHKASPVELVAYLKKHAGQSDYQHIKSEHAYLSVALKVDSAGKLWVYNPDSALITFVSAENVQMSDTLIFTVKIARLVGVTFANEKANVDSATWAESAYLFAWFGKQWNLLTKDGTGRYRVLVSAEGMDKSMSIAYAHVETAHAAWQKRVSRNEAPRKLETLISLGGGKWALTDYGLGKLATNNLSKADREKLAGIAPVKKLSASKSAK